ncbi:MAG: HAMP domain-containing histidine kinase [Saprospiraceae bacterium]|nr:HAMP domain-containing histidine kinase [Saprospiraceae bacterium]
MVKRLLLYVVVMLILFAVAVTAGRQEDNSSLMDAYAQEIGVWLEKQIIDAKSWTSTADSTVQQFEEHESKPYTVLIHTADSLIAWSNTKAIPPARNLKELSTAERYKTVRLPLGWFLVQTEQNNSVFRTTLVPIRYELNFSASEASGMFPANKQISSNLQITSQPSGNQPKVQIAGNTVVCGLEASGPLQSGWLTWLKLGAWAAMFLTFFSLLNQIARAISSKLRPSAGAALLFAAVGIVLYLNTSTGWTQHTFASVSLFNTTFEHANLIGRSIGDWLIHVALLVFVMIYFHRNYRIEKLDQLPAGLKAGIAGLSMSLIMAAIPLTILVARQLIFNSRIGFDFDNFLTIGAGGWLALTGLVIFISGLFLFGHRLALTVRQLELSKMQRWIAIGLGAAVIAVVAVSLDIQLVYAVAVSVLYAVTMDTFVRWEGNGFGWIVVWVLLFSGFASTLLYHYNGENDRALRLQYAQALVVERDSSAAEPLLPVLLADIQQDSAKISRILKPWPFKADISEVRAHLNSLVLRHNYLFQHYRLNVAAFDQENQPVLLGQTLTYQEVVEVQWNAAQPIGSNPDLRFLRINNGKSKYLLRFAGVRGIDVGQKAQVYVLLEHEYLAPNQAYTQLFYRRPYKNLNHLSRYTFAVRNQGNILAEQGRGSLQALSIPFAEKGKAIDWSSEDEHRVDAVALNSDGSLQAAVGHVAGGWLKQVYLFAVFFTLTSLLLLVLAFANSIFNFLPEEYDFRLTAKGSLARRIHLWNVSLLAVSFLVIGLLTYQHFLDAAKDAASSDFNYQAEALQNSLEAPLLNYRDSSATINSGTLVKSFSDMTKNMGVDAGLFAPDGSLLFSTRKDLVDLGILPSKMNYSARVLLGIQHGAAHEVVVNLGPYIFENQFRPCLSGRGELLGYLGMPRPANLAKIGPEVSDFIGMLASLYVFLLLIAFAVTYALSKTITRPLSMLSEKVQELKFTDKNAPLEYEGDNQDEISELIREYNTMVTKLEDSKVQLVRLEREGAWREMARQVAHDIKNPLTTMKLSMQQLERVSSNPEQAAAYLRKAITRLIEQIDSLAQIASEFSMFANLDIRHKNDVVINEVVESVHDLFSEQKNVKLELTLPKDYYHILGDKNHLIRVFNNLVINAIQAIPSDREGHINVSLSQQNQHAVVKISDNGGGIPPEIRDRVFEPNFTTKTSGSGLGLAICKKIIEAHDGAIRFETRENEGTDFFVEIPVSSVN